MVIKDKVCIFANGVGNSNICKYEKGKTNQNLSAQDQIRKNGHCKGAYSEV